MEIFLAAGLVLAAAPHAVSVPLADELHEHPSVSEAALLGLMLCLCFGLASYTITTLPRWALSASEAALLGLMLCLCRGPTRFTTTK